MFPYSSATSAYKPARKSKRKPSPFDPQPLAEAIREKIAALPNYPSSVVKVIEIFATCGGTAMQKYDAFQLLDEKPGLFRGYSDGYWFGLLRQCRNHPVYGRAMFDAINNRY